MHLSTTGLLQLLKENVVELRFKRRLKKQGFNDMRRMLCTNDALLLNSEAVKKILNFKNGRCAILRFIKKKLKISWTLWQFSLN